MQTIHTALTNAASGSTGPSKAHAHSGEDRPWGRFDSVDRGERYHVKHIRVKPGGQLSLQYHHHRSEHWIVVSGTANVTLGKRRFLLSEGQSVFIPKAATHRLENAGHLPVELIEVQFGEYLGEDDIVRLEDVYGRCTEEETTATA